MSNTQKTKLLWRYLDIFGEKIRASVDVLEGLTAEEEAHFIKQNMLIQAFRIIADKLEAGTYPEGVIQCVLRDLSRLTDPVDWPNKALIGKAIC